MSRRDKEFLERELIRAESVASREARAEQERQVLDKWKKEEQEKRKEGKGVFYLKEKDKRKLVEEARMQELGKDKKKLKKVEYRREKKAAGKERKKKPPLRAEME